MVSGFHPIARVALGFAFVLLLLSGPSGAEEKKKAKVPTEDDFPELASPEDDSLVDELPDETEADFPDLVGVDETGGIMDELLFLEEAGTVELPARHAQEIGMSPSAITVITREDIETFGGTRLADLLRLVPGMEVLYVTPMYSSATTRLIWGYTNMNLLVLIDGREINLEMIGQALWGLQPISLEEIERIEVIRGPGSSLYGANALAGVVSITTRKIKDEPSGWVRFNGGQAAILQTAVGASARTGDLSFSLSGGLDLAGAMVDPESSRKEAYLFRALVEYTLSDTQKLLLDVGLINGEGPLTTNLGNIGADGLFVPVRLAYQSESIQAQVSWTPTYIIGDVRLPLEYQGLHLADFPVTEFTINNLDGKVQWNLPDFWDPLLVIIGGRVRAAFSSVDRGLDAETYLDPNSDRYFEEGAEYSEIRTGTYLHAELTPLDWLTVTSGLRLDYNTTSGLFLSPRLASVFQPVEGQFFRLGVSRAFRMPSTFESSLHLAVDFPVDSPFVSESQQRAFREFTTRILGNPDVDDEKLLALEAGYRGEFLEGRLSLSLELYFNIHTDQILLSTDIQLDNTGLPDLRNSKVVFDNAPDLDMRVFGSELSIRYSPSRNLSFLAAWAHREITFTNSGESGNGSPNNMYILGGRFWSDSGILGSLYAFIRAEFKDNYVTNPAGIMEEYLQQKMPDFMMLMGRLGYSWQPADDIRLEAGVKLQLPVSFESPHFRYQEKGGGETIQGQRYGADELRQVVTGYLQGSF